MDGHLVLESRIHHATVPMSRDASITRYLAKQRWPKDNSDVLNRHRVVSFALHNPAHPPDNCQHDTCDKENSHGLTCVGDP